MDIHNYNGDYIVNMDGTIVSMKQNKKRIMSDRIVGHGYKIVSLYKNGVSKNFYVHRLVATHFIPNEENKETVNHIDGDKLNNNVENLEWMTHKENNIHSFGVLGRTGTWKNVKGVYNPSTKIVYMIDGRCVTKFNSPTEAEKITGVSVRSIRRAASSKRKSAGGLIWSYDVPIEYVDDEGATQSYLRPKKIGAFA